MRIRCILECRHMEATADTHVNCLQIFLYFFQFSNKGHLQLQIHNLEAQISLDITINIAVLMAAMTEAAEEFHKKLYYPLSFCY